MASDRPQEQYTIGYSEAAVRSFSSRTAADDAGFFLPYLSPGMTLLDCGCGPGTITLGLAKEVSPGQVVGVDMEESQVRRAQARASSEGVDNVRFETGSVYELTFPDETFDAVLMHCVLDHLSDPIVALKEANRVMKPGGVIGTRCPMGGDIFEPSDSMGLRFLELYERLREHNGSERSLGRRLRGLVSEAGFVRVEATASFDTYGSLESTRFWGERVAGAAVNPPIPQQLIELGWADHDELEQIGAWWRSWGENPNAFYAKPCGEAVGWKE